MALYDEKKKPGEPGYAAGASSMDSPAMRDKRGLTKQRPPAAPVPAMPTSTAVAPAPAPVAAPQPGTKIGHLTLLPGSGADVAAKAVGAAAGNVVDAVSGFRAQNQATLQGMAQMTRANNLHFINPADPQSMTASPPSPAPFTRASAPPAAVAPAAPVPAPRTPAQLEQASRDEIAARTQAPNTSRPADVGASLPAGGGGTDIVGTFNGRQITRAQSDAIAGKLPTVGGGGLADAVGVQPAAPVLARQNTAAAYGAPTAPQAAPADLRAANEADAKLRSDIDSQLFRMSFAAGRPGREGRAAQQAMTQLMGLQQGSVEGQGKRAVDIAGGDRNAVLDTNRTTAGLATSDADRALRAQQGSETLQLQREGQNKGGQVLTGDDGTASLLRPDGSLAPLTSQDGGAFRPRAAASTGEITPAGRLDFIGKQIEAVQRAMSTSIDPKAQEGFKTQLDNLNQQATALTAAPAAPTTAQVELLKANPNQAADFDAKFGKGAAAKLLGK